MSTEVETPIHTSKETMNNSAENQSLAEHGKGGDAETEVSGRGEGVKGEVETIEIEPKQVVEGDEEDEEYQDDEDEEYEDDEGENIFTPIFSLPPAGAFCFKLILDRRFQLLGLHYWFLCVF